LYLSILIRCADISWEFAAVLSNVLNLPERGSCAWRTAFGIVLIVTQSSVLLTVAHYYIVIKFSQVKETLHNSNSIMDCSIEDFRSQRKTLDIVNLQFNSTCKKNCSIDTDCM